MNSEVPPDAKRWQYLMDIYERIGIAYKRISWMDVVEIKRCYPVYFRVYEDCERELDKSGHTLDQPTFRHMCEKMATAWDNMVYKVEQDLKNNAKRGMPAPLSHATPSGLRIYREDTVTPLVRVGYCTLDEIKLWVEKKITIEELQKRNVAEFSKEFGRRFNKQFMIYCELAEEPKVSLNLKPEPCPVCALRNKNQENITKTLQNITKPNLEQGFIPPPVKQQVAEVEPMVDEDGLMELNLDIKTGWE